MALPTRHKKKKKEEVLEGNIDDFNRFGLQYKDYDGEAFLILEGTQVVMNYKCKLNADHVTSSYRNYLKK